MEAGETDLFYTQLQQYGTIAQNIESMHSIGCACMCGGGTYMALGLWLVAVLSHNLLKRDVETKDFSHDVDTAHDDLIQVSIPH